MEGNKMQTKDRAGDPDLTVSLCTVQGHAENTQIEWAQYESLPLKFNPKATRISIRFWLRQN